MKASNITDKLAIPEGVQVTVERGAVTVKGAKAELTRSFRNPKVQISVEGAEVLLKAPVFTRYEKKMIGTYRAHIRNMMKGVTHGHEYILKICSGHFPMSVAVSGSQLVVKNFIGEKVPRALRIPAGVQVKVDGDRINVTGPEKESASQTAASIELLTKRTKFDKRIFQDGIYIVNKDGKEIR